jgi:hypothetical protein
MLKCPAKRPPPCPRTGDRSAMTARSTHQAVQTPTHGTPDRTSSTTRSRFPSDMTRRPGLRPAERGGYEGAADNARYGELGQRVDVGSRASSVVAGQRHTSLEDDVRCLRRDREPLEEPFKRVVLQVLLGWTVVPAGEILQIETCPARGRRSRHPPTYSSGTFNVFRIGTSARAK